MQYGPARDAGLRRSCQQGQEDMEEDVGGEAGHRHAVDYGFSFFLQALEEQNRSRAERMCDLAQAVRAGMWADEKSFKEFLQDGQKRNP